MNELVDISDKDFEEFSQQFYLRSGIRLTSQKKYLITNRLQKLIRTNNEINSFSDLSRIIREGTDKELISQFVDALTTNYSYFFRDPVHFRFLKYHFTKKAASNKRIRIWSAACSSGEEPYSIALIIHEFFPEMLTKGVEILASDISQSMLIKAKNGVYNRSDLTKNLNEAAQSRYFEPTQDLQFLRVKREIKNLVTFRKINLLEPYPLKASYDIIFLRNVLIYFDREKKERVLSNLSNYLKDDGYLIISMSESLVGVGHPFKHIRHSIYKL